jgi:hypothetical protein
MNDTPEEIKVAPNVPHEGESRGSMQPPEDLTGSRGKVSAGSKRKRPEEEEYIDLDTPQKTCGKHIDYQYLNDPFPDKEGETQEDNLVVQSCISAANTKAQSGGDNPKSLKRLKGPQNGWNGNMQ